MEPALSEFSLYRSFNAVPNERPEPIRTARRNITRQDRIGSDSFCLFCGYGCLESLTSVSTKWLEEHGIPRSLIHRLLEEHHIFGYAHDPI